MTDDSYWPPEPFAPPGQFRSEPTAPLPQYGTPSHGQAPYGTPPYGYGVPHYPPAPYPPPPGLYGRYPGQGYPDPRDERPGTVVGAAVLGFIESGVLLFTTVWLWIVASVVSAVDDNTDDGFISNFDGLAQLLFFTGVLNVAASGLFIAGGVLFMQRKTSGAIMYLVGVAVVIATFIVWLVVQGDVFWFGELMFIVAPVIGLAIAGLGGTWRWLRAGRTEVTTGPQ